MAVRAVAKGFLPIPRRLWQGAGRQAEAAANERIRQWQAATGARFSALVVARGEVTVEGEWALLPVPAAPTGGFGP